MTKRPRLLDAFCGAGGCTRGYQLAGFEVTGVDNRPQPRYVGEHFVEGDALEYIAEHGHEFDAIHASPPCQGYSRMRHLPWLKGRVYPMLIDPTRALLEETGRPWVIENVEDAPLRNGITLCGYMLGLAVYRHRKFESSLVLINERHRSHPFVIGAESLYNDRRKHGSGSISSWQQAGGVGGHFGKRERAEAAMGIDWMSTAELSQAIPPAYTEYIGRQLLAALRTAA